MFGVIFALMRGRFTNFLGSEIYAPDLIAALAAYLFLIYGRTGACIFAVSQGLVMDLFSGGVQGLFVFIYLGVFGAIWLGSGFFDLQSSKGQILILFFAMIVKSIFFFVVVGTVFQKSVSGAFLLSLGFLTLITALVTPIIFYIFNMLRSLLFDDFGNGSAGPV